MSDLAEQLKRRQRSKVSRRTAIVTEQIAPDQQPSGDSSVPLSVVDSLVETDKNLLPEDDYRNFELAQATLRIEKNIAGRLMEFCHQGHQGHTKISREALIEAMFLQVENDPELREVVLDLATDRSELRKRAGNFKRGKSISDRA